MHEWGEEFVRWTVRGALVPWVVCLWWRMGDRQAGATRGYRILWTAGCLAMWVHVAAAFHFVHGWSHAAALQHTAERTGEVLGWFWGGGIYFNYLFLALWSADVVRLWWATVDFGRLGLWLEVIVISYLAFIVLHAVVVFEEGMLRWIGIFVTGGVITRLVRK